MRSILFLLIVLFFGALAQAQQPTAIKVQVAETAAVTLVDTGKQIFQRVEPIFEISLIYKRRLSVVKKHLFFTVRKHRVKVA